MAIYHPTSVTCSCGNTFPAHVAHTPNVRRSPDLRRKILRLELHRVVCPRCHETMTIERPMAYVDPDRNAVFFVQPRGSRVGYRRDSSRLAAATTRLPSGLSPTKGRQARVVYGLDELREKLVAQDLKLDDRVVELLKTLVLYEHPFLMRRSRLQLFLAGAEKSRIRFVAYHHNRNEGWEVLMPRAIADDLAKREPELRAWAKQAHPKRPLFDLPDSWVNIRRWTLRYDPLDALRTFAAMSPYEFFAEIYALYYDQDDLDRHVISGNAEVASWLDRHVGGGGIRRIRASRGRGGRRGWFAGGRCGAEPVPFIPAYAEELR